MNHPATSVLVSAWRVFPGLFLLTLCLMSTAGPVWAQSPEQSFDQANLLYQQNKFGEARDAYEAIVHEGFVSGELYYNLGNAYYKTGDLGKAILNFERALRFMPNDDDLKHNLQLANLMIVDRIEPTPRLFLWDDWDGVKSAFCRISLGFDATCASFTSPVRPSNEM